MNIPSTKTDSMLTDELIDEDIEALLYAQVYYGKSDIADSSNFQESNLNVNKESTVGTANVESPETNIVPEKEFCQNPNLNIEEPQGEKVKDSTKKTDFSENLLETCTPDNLNQDQFSLPEYIEPSTSLTSTNLTEEDSTQIITQIPIAQTSIDTTNFLLNNRTNNQYICSGELFLNRLKVFKESIVWSKQCEKDLKRFQKGKLNEKEFFTILERRQSNQWKKLKKQDQIRKVFFTRQKKLALTEVICLSDSDNSDLEIIGVDIVSPAKNPKVVKRNIIMSTIDDASYDEDDEIIYVPPPPVPVIDVDEESGSSEEANTPQQLLEKSQELDDASNDFLAPTNTSEKFNFSLHGSEFQDAEFVRPANPTDTYETESSTSTSDFNRESSREFTNSVKTIVFNEVDFPREDIFEESNLEKFGELITPNNQIENDEAKSKDNENINSKESLPAKLRTSSESSSECDYLEVHNNLPDLSPMVSVDSFRKSENTHLKVGDESQNSTKLSSFSQGCDGIIDVDTEDSSPKKSLKRRNSVLIDDCVKKRSKKKKKKSDKPLSNDVEILALAEDEISTSISTIIRTESNQELSKKKSKKKKRQMKSIDNMAFEELVSPEDTRKRRTKKKKNVDTSLNENNILDDSIDKRTKRTKKHKQKPTTINDAKNVAFCSPEKQVNNKHNLESGPAENIEEPQMMTVEDQDREVSENMAVADGVIHTIQWTEPAQALEKVLVETKEDEEEDVILIEKDIPVHTIESSDSDYDDIQTFDDAGDELKLANIDEDVDKTNSKKLEEFDVAHVQSKMSDDPEKWKILASDRFNLNVSAKRGLRCRKCRQYGHMAIRCPNKPVIPSCTMCGYEGHQEPRCPNRVCFTCGHPSKYSTVSCHRCGNQKNMTCYVCQLPGHSGSYCPDLWRRYYLTTKEGPLVKPKRKSMNLKPRNKLWCSGCASKGHLEFECSSYKWIKKYPTSSPRVFKFKDVYESEKKNAGRKSSDSNFNRTDSAKEQTNVEIEELTSGYLSKSTVNETAATNQDLPLNFQKPITTSHPAGTSQDFSTEELTPRSVEYPRSSRRERIGQQPRFKAKLNPFSVWRKTAEPTGYTPYQSIFNPCSVLEVNAFRNATNEVSSFVGSATLGLFNALSNLASCNIGQQDNQYNFSQRPQHNPRFPYSNNDTEFSQSWQNNNYSNRNYLDVPYTITSEPSCPSDYDNRNLQFNHRHSVMDSQRPNKNLSESSSNTQQGFLSLTLDPLETEATYKPVKLDNVEELTAKKFIHFSIEDLNEFLSSELDKLDNIKNFDAKIYKKKLNNIEQLQKINLKTNSVKKQIYFHYKHINMFLFGIQKLAEGKKNIDILRNFLYQPGRQLFDSKRNTLLAAYGYIFGGEHPNFNYRKHLNALSVGQTRHEMSRPQ